MEMTNETSFVVMPAQANHYGNVHGGVIMHEADNAAYVLASRYSRMNVVTARVAEINFTAPVKEGDLVILRLQIVRVGRSSMDIRVCVSGEDLSAGTEFAVADALFTMVAVDENGRPKAIGDRSS